jgi:signal transduction histidine kinase/CheY-like chemotaxis protein
MSNSADSAFPLATEVLVATFRPDGSVSTRNPAWLSLFGPTSDAWAALSPDDREMACRALAEATSGTLVTNQVFFLPIPSRDQPVPVLLHFIPVNTNPDAAVQAVTVTGEVLAEPGSLVLSQTRRHRLENLGGMTLGLVHEFSNVLTTIQGNLDYLEQLGGLPANRPELRAVWRDLHQAARNGAAITQTAKNYFKNEKGAQTDLIDLPSLIQECVSMTRPYWYNEPRRHGITIATKFDLQPVPPVVGSTVNLRQVFVNLIINAVHAMPVGGTLLFRTVYDRKIGVVAHVSDTGHGMTEAVKQRIFEPFFTTKGKQGTGMGLAICYSIVEHHQGTIVVDSVLGEGTTFTLVFPASEAQPAPEESTPVSTARRTVRVLAVDDEPGVRNVLQNLMRLQGHTVEVASSGTEALHLLDAREIDLVITDHGMAGMNGRQLARRIKDRFPEMPVVLLTGDTDAGVPDDTVDAIVGKPFRMDELQHVIDELA